MVAYATRQDVFDLGLSAQAFVVRSRQATADTATGIIRLEAHGMGDEDFVTFEVTSGGSLPTGLSAFTEYAVVSLGLDLFRVKDPNSDLPIESFVSGGSGWSVKVDLMRRLDRHIEASAARINEHLTAHKPPLDAPYPVQVVEINARMAARRMVTSLQFDNAAYRVATDRLFDLEAQDEAQLQRWMAGKPVHPRPTDQSPSIADNGARASSSRVPAGWNPRRLW